MNKTLQQVDFMVPGLRTVSEANSREHWGTRNRRKIAQQQEVAVAMHNALRGRRVELPCVVKLTRIGPNQMDDDNLIRSCKGIRDILALKLGVDDGDTKKIRFEYDQMPIKVRQYGLKIEIKSASIEQGAAETSPANPLRGKENERLDG